MATISAIRDGLKTRLATITSLHAYDVLPDNLVVPAAIVRPLRGDYYSTMTNKPHDQFEILVLVALVRLSTGQDALDPYLSAT